MHPNVAEAIRRSAAVPSMPQVVTRFLEVIQDPNFDYNSVVKVLSVDPGTVGEILRLANSALFGVSRKVTSLKQALTLLGPKRTRSLVLGRFLVETMDQKGTTVVDRSYLWRRSLACGVIAARLADNVCPRQRDEVFICALLADIGVSILAKAFPTEYLPFAQAYAPYGAPFREEDERAAVQTCHSEVSAMVLGQWSLPETLCSALRRCHDDGVVVADESTQMAAVINAADRIAKLLCEIPDVNHCVETCMRAMVFVGVDVQILVRLLGEVEKDVEELALILKIDVIPSAVYAKIAEAIQERLTLAATG